MSFDSKTYNFGNVIYAPKNNIVVRKSPTTTNIDVIHLIPKWPQFKYWLAAAGSPRMGHTVFDLPFVLSEMSFLRSPLEALADSLKLSASFGSAGVSSKTLLNLLRSSWLMSIAFFTTSMFSVLWMDRVTYTIACTWGNFIACLKKLKCWKASPLT